jgi:Family of unknown function (DUF5758)
MCGHLEIGVPMKNDYRKSLKPIGKKGHLFEVISPIRVFKKVYVNGGNHFDVRAVVAELEIPVGALVVVPTELGGLEHRIMFQKQRASEAKVIRIRDISTDATYKTAESAFDCTFKYTVGKTVKPTKAFNKIDYACTSGIHFFRTYTQAREY